VDLSQFDHLGIAKLFASKGYWVFPIGKTERNKKITPYGWAKNDVIDPQKIDKAIPATNDPQIVDTWPMLLRTKYDCTIGGFGILGENCIILDLDVKENRPGFTEFNRLLKDHGLPNPGMITVTKTSGIHAFYKRPPSLQNAYIKTLTNVVVDGVKYVSVDLRGNGGYVVGPYRFIEDINQYIPGMYATKGFCAAEELPEIPEKVLIQWSKTIDSRDIDSITMGPSEVKEDFRSKIRRGEIPDFVPKGSRNECFFILISVLKGKGVPADVARQMCLIMREKVEEPETFDESVDIDAIIQRVYVMQADNPYDVAVDLINKGLFQLTNYRNQLCYVILEDNPYVGSKNPHDEKSIRTLLMRYQKTIQMENGKSKIVNPIDIVTRILHDENRADSLGFKPNAGTVFNSHDDPGSRRFLNTYKEIHKPAHYELRNDMVWEEFKFLVSRIFGEPDSEEFAFAMDFVAWLIQYPNIKPSIAPYIISMNRGVGKSLFFNVLIQIFGISKRGDRQARLTKIDEITGRFFDPTGCIVNLIDEVQFPAHRDIRKESTAFWRHLKNLITAETVSVEIKGGATHQLPNSAAMMLAGNAGSYFPIEDFDRRLWLIDNNPPLLERGVVDHLFSLINGYEVGVDERRKMVTALRHHLYEHKIQHDLAAMRAPMTDIKKEMLYNSLSLTEEWFLRHAEDRENLLSFTPIVSKSSLMYLLETQAPPSKYYDNAELIFKDFKRKGHIHAIRAQRNHKLSRQFMINEVGPDGRVREPKKEILYTIREHGVFDEMDSRTIIHLYNQNLHTINEHRNNAKKAFKDLQKLDQELIGEEKG
jgi:hypothetical protein